jgi:hypothetical protein
MHEIKFYVNDETWLRELSNRLAMSITLKFVHKIFIDDVEFNLDVIRKEHYKKGMLDIRESPIEGLKEDNNNEL